MEYFDLIQKRYAVRAYLATPVEDNTSKIFFYIFFDRI